MPVYDRQSLAERPDWVVVSDFELIHLDPLGGFSGTRLKIEALPDRQAVIVVGGSAIARSSLGVQRLGAGSWIIVPDDGIEFDATGSNTPGEQLQLLRVQGCWGDGAHFGAFWIHEAAPLEIHYHDFDEYWFLLHGTGIAHVDGRDAPLGPGNLVATPAGYEHGMPEVSEWVSGVAFKPDAAAAGRRGHLHREEHGAPAPSRTL